MTVLKAGLGTILGGNGLVAVPGADDRLTIYSAVVDAG